jgi:predicted nucleic acid-binding protein
MSRLIVLDSGPVGLVTNPRNTPENEPCKRWLRGLLAAGERVALPEVVDYEMRRELLRAGKRRGLRNLDRLGAVLDYLPITTATM